MIPRESVEKTKKQHSVEEKKKQHSVEEKKTAQVDNHIIDNDLESIR